jgi:NADP-dependent alcohol dehydrogenase
MNNFTYYNPVRIVFGMGSIAKLGGLLAGHQRILLAYGGGSIMKNGVHAQVRAALATITPAPQVFEFGGIEPNPRYETLMPAVALVKRERIDFLLAVGGGSVLDGVKFIAAAALFAGADAWDIAARGAAIQQALPLGSVMTLPATGSEMNGNSVVSRNSTGEKLAFSSPRLLPQFSILDPATTLSLPDRQVANGIVDAFVHVHEQYMTTALDAPLQDRQAEAVLMTLIEQAPLVRQRPDDLAVRANLMWCATHALNDIIACGVPQDWSSHIIGHELTALYGLDHAQTLAIVLPGVWDNQFAVKRPKLAQYGRRVWNLQGPDDAVARKAIERTAAFFEAVGTPVRFAVYNIDAARAAEQVVARLAARGHTSIGERGAISLEDVRRIVAGR